MPPETAPPHPANGHGASGGRGAHTRDMILNAARTVFARHSYRGASLRMIAAQGGFYHGLIRHHFPSKAVIFEAVAASACTELKEANRRWLLEISVLPPRQALSLYLDRFIDHFRNRREAFAMIAQNLSEEGVEDVPGFNHLVDLLRGSRADFIRILGMGWPHEACARFLESFNALILHYLGSARAEARLLGMDAESDAYLNWVKETMMFIFLPVLEQHLSD